MRVSNRWNIAGLLWIAPGSSVTRSVSLWRWTIRPCFINSEVNHQQPPSAQGNVQRCAVSMDSVITLPGHPLFEVGRSPKLEHRKTALNRFSKDSPLCGNKGLRSASPIIRRSEEHTSELQSH